MRDEPLINRVQVLCGNKVLLTNKQKGAHKLHDTSDRDALHTIDLLQQEMAFCIQHGYVPGHQDTRGKRGKNLTLAEHYNVRADELAQKVNRSPSLLAEAKEAYPFPNTVPHLGSEGTIITSAETSILRETLAEKDYVEYLREVKRWPDSTINAIDWYSRYTVLATLPALTHRTISKLTHGWLPTNGRQHTMDKRHNPACPICGTEETNTHLLRCHGQAQWKTQTMSLCNEALRKHNTAADLRQSILYCMECWLTDSPADINHSAYHHGIGEPPYSWQLVFTGHIPLHWVQLQAQSRGTRYWPDKGGNAWSRNLGKCLMTATGTAWHQRNQHQHDPTGANTEAGHHHIMYLKIRALCQERHCLLAIDREYFDLNPQEFCCNKGPK